MRHYSPNYIYHRIRRELSSWINYHPSSHPYIAGDTFRSISNHVRDERTKIDPASISENDIIFVESTYLKDFIEKTAPKIKCNYVLITHNGDLNITDEFLPFLESETLKHWFAQNCLIEHSKITPLPIGLENSWYSLHGLPKYFDKLKMDDPVKKTAILYKFSLRTNPVERTIALKALEMNPIAETFTDWKEPFVYLKHLQQYKFVASPIGNGLDCIRTWEAMCLKTIPIVTDTSMSRYFVSLGLPMLILNNWTDIQDMSSQDLDNIYAKMEDKFDNPAIYADFWINKIKNYDNK